MALQEEMKKVAVSSKQELETSPSIHFLKALFAEVTSGNRVNKDLSQKLNDELRQRELRAQLLAERAQTGQSSELPQEDEALVAEIPVEGGVPERDWDMYRKKLLRFRPRLAGAVAAYATLANLSHKQMHENGGMALFRMMWFLGSSQDDLIDELQSHDMPEDERERIHTLRKAIFGPDRTFYRAAFTVVAKEINNADFTPEAKRYLKIKIATWYRFLLKQESGALARTLTGLDFKYCRAYREDQNQNIGEVLTACLNGARCLDPKFQQLERLVPLLSFRTQIIDDIADLPEDLAMSRPSYAVGALVDHPQELAAVRAHIEKHKLGKVTPRLLKDLAPESFNVIMSVQRKYGEQLKEVGDKSDFLRSVGDVLFDVFPRIRDVVYRISPAHANF